MSSEAILNFLINKLKVFNTDLSKEFIITLEKRINGRRNPKLISLLKYLQNSGKIVDNSQFMSASKSSFIQFAKDMTKRLFPTKNENQIKFYLEEKVMAKWSDSKQYPAKISKKNK